MGNAYRILRKAVNCIRSLSSISLKRTYTEKSLGGIYQLLTRQQVVGLWGLSFSTRICISRIFSYENVPLLKGKQTGSKNCLGVKDLWRAFLGLNL